jgi:hypothetical protein
VLNEPPDDAIRSPPAEPSVGLAASAPVGVPLDAGPGDLRVTGHARCDGCQDGLALGEEIGAPAGEAYRREDVDSIGVDPGQGASRRAWVFARGSHVVPARVDAVGDTVRIRVRRGRAPVRRAGRGGARILRTSVGSVGDSVPVAVVGSEAVVIVAGRRATVLHDDRRRRTRKCRASVPPVVDPVAVGVPGSDHRRGTLGGSRQLGCAPCGCRLTRQPPQTRDARRGQATVKRAGGVAHERPHPTARDGLGEPRRPGVPGA